MLWKFDYLPLYTIYLGHVRGCEVHLAVVMRVKQSWMTESTGPACNETCLMTNRVLSHIIC